MEQSLKRELTTILQGLNAGRAGAFAELVNLVYDDLRAIAAGRMRKQFDRPAAALTLSPTAIAHDVVVRLREQRAAWVNTDQFFAVATRLLQQLILDYQKHRLRDKRGGGNRGGGLDAARHVEHGDTGAARVDMLDLISRLHDEHPRAAEVVTLHVLCDLSLPRVAETMGAPMNQVESDWRLARSWLKTRLRPK